MHVDFCLYRPSIYTLPTEKEYNFMVISLFSGQGSQYCDMGKDIAEANPELLAMYDKASDIIGRDLKRICFEAEAEELNQTINSQPAIMITSLVCLEAAKKKGFEFSGAAGHSLGEYAAMTASGVISFEDGFRLIKARAEAMDKAAKENSGSMAAVLKLEPEKIEEVCSTIDGYVVPVNYNSPQQTVIAGETKAVESAMEKLAELGGRVKLLNVASGFHSKLMETAAKEFYETAKTITYKKPEIKYYSNLTGAELTDFSDMADILAKHIVSPVRFTSELAAMAADGFDTFVEFGPNKVLTGLVKKTFKGVKAFNIENCKNLEEAFS